MRYMVEVGPFFVEIPEIAFVPLLNSIYYYHRPAGVEVRLGIL
jgi:hypothetical protein